MKKIIVFALFISVCFTSYAQQTIINTSPVYDNINYEQQMQQTSPMHNTKYVLLEKDENIPSEKLFIQGRNLLMLSGNDETDRADPLDHAIIINGLKQSYIQHGASTIKKIKPVNLSGNMLIPGAFYSFPGTI